MQILYSYFRYTGRLFLGCGLFLVLSHSLMRNQEVIKTDLQKKAYRRICVRDIFFSTACPPFLSFFVAFFIYCPSQVTYLLNGPNKNTYCYGLYSVQCQKYEILLQFNTSWLAFLRT